MPPPRCPDEVKAQREDGVVLRRAQDASQDTDWENAGKLYAEAMKSCVPEIAKKASDEYGAMRGRSGRWWWDTPVVTTVVRRFVRYPWSSRIFLALLLLFLAVLLSWLRFRERSFGGKARLILPSKLTDDGLPELFAAEVCQASQDVDKCLKAAGRDYFAGALNLVSAPAADLASLTDKLPDILGVSFGKWAGFFLAVPRYFSWRVETWQGFLNPANDGQIRVRALLCRAGGIYEGWDFTRSAANKFDIQTSAFALAARLKGEAIFRSGSTQTELKFAAAESFCLFAEGLRALQMYGSESDSPKPQKERLDSFLSVALDSLRECAEEYPDDLLSRFYYGIALTVANQKLYVDRLYELRNSFAAWGRLLDLQDAGGQVDSERFTRKQHEQHELAEQAKAAQDLGNEDWGQLRQAADIFDKLQSCGVSALKQAAAYNLAVVYGRLGETDDIEKARKILEGFEPLKSGPLSWVSALLGRGRANDLRALSLQAAFEKEMLDHWLAARHAVHDEDNTPASRKAALNSYEEESRKLDETVDKIRSSGLPDNMRQDLEAELWTKRGYLRYEMATYLGARTLLPGESSKDHLKQAKEFLKNALERKPHWNPAQVYMALVLQVMGDADGAKSYFQSLRGVEKRRGPIDMAAD
jgi:hypothetical protein